MVLYMIGLGLGDEKDITLKGLEAVKQCKKVYLESYTSLLQCSVSDLEKLYGKKIIIADREKVEKQADEILEHAKDSHAALLVIGDPFSATTHVDIMMRAKEKNVAVKIIHNASVLTAVGITGLQLYKFGKTTSLPFDYQMSRTAYSVIEQNKSLGMHTLVLLDIFAGKKNEEDKQDKQDKQDNQDKQYKFMTVNQAIELLLKRGKEESGSKENKKDGKSENSKNSKNIFTEKTLCIGCARLGSETSVVKSGTAKELLKFDFGKPVHCLIVPGKMHFMEEEAVESLK